MIGRWLVCFEGVSTAVGVLSEASPPQYGLMDKSHLSTTINPYEGAYYLSKPVAGNLWGKEIHFDFHDTQPEVPVLGKGRKF